MLKYLVHRIDSSLTATLIKFVLQESYEDEMAPVNHYESEYGKVSQQKSASIKKIEDEYSLMKAALLSSMDSEDEVSECEGYGRNQPKDWEGSNQKSTEKSESRQPGQSKATPSNATNLDLSENHNVLSISHGRENQLDLESKLNLGSSKRDIDKHEDVLDRKTSCDGSYGLHLSKGRSRLVF